MESTSDLCICKVLLDGFGICSSFFFLSLLLSQIHTNSQKYKTWYDKSMETKKKYGHKHETISQYSTAAEIWSEYKNNQDKGTNLNEMCILIIPHIFYLKK